MVARAKEQIAFYGTTPNYAFQFDDLGYEGTTTALRLAMKSGDLDTMRNTITDEMLEHYAVVAPWNEMADRLLDRYGPTAERVALYLLDEELRTNPDALAKWEAAKRGNRAAFAAMRPGARGVDVDRAQRALMDEDGSIPVMWSTGHPVGYWAHDSGPSLGGGQAGRTPRGRQLDVLRPGMTFAFDGFHSWPLTGEDTKTISVEEMVVITEDGAEWLVPPQEDLILIPSR